VGPRIEHQVPERQSAEHGAPTHQFIERVAQHGVEEDRRQKPNDLAHDVKRGRDSNVEQEFKRRAERA